MKRLLDVAPDDAGEHVLVELFRHLPVGVVLTDLHGTILDLNEALCSILDYPRDSLIGRALPDLVHPDESSDVRERTRKMREGELGSFEIVRRFVSRNRETVHARVYGSVVYSQKREPICGIGFVENISQSVAMEEALRQSESRYRRVVEDQTELIVRCLPDGTRTFVNEAYCRYFGAQAESLVGTSFFPHIVEEEREIVRSKYDGMTPENPVAIDEHRVVRPDGTIGWHQWIDRGIFDDQRKLIEIQAVGRDVTAEYEGRAQVRKSEERYRRLFNNLPVAAWESDWSDALLHLRRQGIASAEALNEALARDDETLRRAAAHVRLLGANHVALELAGVPDVDAYRQWLVTKAFSRPWARRYAEAAGPLLFGDTRTINVDFTLTRMNGELVDVLYRLARSERWGEEWTVFGIAVDVTERNRMQREILHHQQLTERAEAAVHFGSWEWVPGNDSVFGSSEFWRILDGSEDDRRERPLQSCFATMHPDDARASAEAWEGLRQPSSEPQKPTMESEYRVSRHDGTSGTVSSQSFFTFDGEGRLTRAFGILRDVTDVRRAERESERQREELLRADKMISLGILVSGVAHEINNPNHSIMLNAPLLRDAWRDVTALIDQLPDTSSRIARMPWDQARAEVAGMIADIEHASERIRTIVNELRGFALDQDPGARRSCSVNDIVHSSLRLVGNLIRKATRNLQVQLADALPQVQANAQRVEQVVVNLVINACQALQSETQSIHVHTGSGGDRVFIRVVDEGRGITAEHLANIRTPFFTTRRAEGGTGLGLAVSDRIVEEHGGELAFESEPGRGTTATLWLPCSG